MKNSIKILSIIAGFMLLGCIVYASATTARTSGVNKLPWNGAGDPLSYTGSHHRGTTNDGDKARFTGSLGSGNIITDTRTGLQWESVPSLTTGTGWTQAIVYCASLELGGHSDWRLPNIRELMSIADFSKTDGISYWYGSKFILEALGYWSSTTYANNTMAAHSLSFSNGNMSFNNKGNNSNHVICTR